MPAWSMFGRGRSRGARSRRGARGRRAGGTTRGGAGTLLGSSEAAGAASGCRSSRRRRAVTGRETRGRTAVRFVARPARLARRMLVRCEARSRAANTPPRASSATAAATIWRRDPDRSRSSNDGSSRADRSSGGESRRRRARSMERPWSADRTAPRLRSPASASPESSRICVLRDHGRRRSPPAPRSREVVAPPFLLAPRAGETPTAAAQARRPTRSAPRVRRASPEGRSLPAPPAGRI